MSRLVRLFLLSLWTLPAIAQVLLQATSLPLFRAFDRNGEPLAAGKLYSYRAGTTTPLATYTDVSGNTPNRNPVILDSTGTARVYLGDATYKLVLQNQCGVVQWSVDNIQGMVPASILQSPYGNQTVRQPYPTIVALKTAKGKRAAVMED
jgi:hypothetical protein